MEKLHFSGLFTLFRPAAVHIPRPPMLRCARTRHMKAARHMLPVCPPDAPSRAETPQGGGAVQPATLILAELREQNPDRQGGLPSAQFAFLCESNTQMNGANTQYSAGPRARAAKLALLRNSPLAANLTCHRRHRRTALPEFSEVSIGFASQNPPSGAKPTALHKIRYGAFSAA